MESMWKIAFDDDLTNGLKPPNEIVDAQCSYLNELTGGKILARTSAYRSDHAHDVGDDDSFRYEFFLTSPATPHYRFTIMTMRYEIGFYPLRIDLDIDVAEELSDNANFDAKYGSITCEDEASFTEALSIIINSKKVKKVIASLYSIIKSKERKEQTNAQSWY